jgi:hypothetical protein
MKYFNVKLYYKMYYNKYIKYKIKYLNLLNDLSGGVNDIPNFFTSEHDDFKKYIGLNIEVDTNSQLNDSKKLKEIRRKLLLLLHGDKIMSNTKYNPLISDTRDIRYQILSALIGFLNTTDCRIDSIKTVIDIQKKFADEESVLFDDIEKKILVINRASITTVQDIIPRYILTINEMSKIEKDKIKQELLNKKNKRQTEADERQKRVFDARRAEIDREAYRERNPLEGRHTEADDRERRHTEADERQKKVFDARRVEIDREAYRKRIPIEGSQTEADRERRQTEADNRERILREFASKIDIMSKIVLNIIHIVNILSNYIRISTIEIIASRIPRDIEEVKINIYKVKTFVKEYVELFSVTFTENTTEYPGVSMETLISAIAEINDDVSNLLKSVQCVENINIDETIRNLKENIIVSEFKTIKDFDKAMIKYMTSIINNSNKLIETFKIAKTEANNVVTAIERSVIRSSNIKTTVEKATPERSVSSGQSVSSDQSVSSGQSVSSDKILNMEIPIIGKKEQELINTIEKIKNKMSTIKMDSDTMLNAEHVIAEANSAFLAAAKKAEEKAVAERDAILAEKNAKEKVDAEKAVVENAKKKIIMGNNAINAAINAEEEVRKKNTAMTMAVEKAKLEKAKLEEAVVEARNNRAIMIRDMEKAEAESYDIQKAVEKAEAESVAATLAAERAKNKVIKAKQNMEIAMINTTNAKNNMNNAINDVKAKKAMLKNAIYIAEEERVAMEKAINEAEAERVVATEASTGAKASTDAFAPELEHAIAAEKAAMEKADRLKAIMEQAIMEKTEADNELEKTKIKKSEAERYMERTEAYSTTSLSIIRSAINDAINKAYDLKKVAEKILKGITINISRLSKEKTDKEMAIINEIAYENKSVILLAIQKADEVISILEKNIDNIGISDVSQEFKTLLKL